MTGVLVFLLEVSAVGLGIFTLASYLGRFWWVLDLTTHFRVQYAAGLGVISLLLLWLDRPLAAGASVFLLVLNGLPVLPFLWQPARAQARQPGLRVFSANVLQKNDSYGRLIAQIQAAQPDFIALCETNQDWIAALAPLEVTYPYKFAAVRENNYGVALYSRLPFESVVEHRFGVKDVPSIVARFVTESGPLTILVTHPPPPKGKLNSEYRNAALAGLAEFTAAQDHATILCGDLNITPWSPFFHDLLVDGRLFNSSVGFGLQTSWPADYRFFLRIPIDHCLVSAGIKIPYRTTGRPFGSDHFPVVVDFSLSG